MSELSRDQRRPALRLIDEMESSTTLLPYARALILLRGTVEAFFRSGSHDSAPFFEPENPNEPAKRWAGDDFS